MVAFPEAARERDLQRYYQPWLDAQNLVHAADGRGKGLTYEGYQPQSSRDRALTAFAQLAALRLDVRRAMVSLIDTSRQYILAEATRTLSLFDNSAERKEDEMWLGNTIIARADAVCHYTFGSTYTAREENGEAYIADALIIPDCRLDARVSHRDYVKNEPGVRFYAGVPITTKAGHLIGVYAVSDDKPRDGLRAAEVRFMQDVAAAVMEHLELAKDSDDRNKGERLVRGLTEFIERSSAQESRDSPKNRPTTMEKQTENARLEAIADEAGPIEASAKSPQRKPDTERESDTARIFQRAARIVRQSTRADGVVFFDTSAARIGGHLSEHPSMVDSSDENSYSSTAGSTTTTRRRRREKSGAASTNQSSINTEGSSSSGLEGSSAADSKPCPLVGLSIRTGAGTTNEEDFIFTEASMERYIQRYPHGKFFNFDGDGVGITSSDERSERSEPEVSDRLALSTATPRRARKKKDRFVPTELLKVLPNVRSLIFLPLWDPAAERWAAGGFIWTMATGRLMNPENELPYLKAFGNSIMSEVARSSAQKSDRAKTTFIASISHELRSPLHGILGSVEFLRDTVSSAYQQTLVSSIETCGKTLLDTIDHVLDYAKINKLRSTNPRRRQRGEARKLPADNSILGVTTVFNLAQLVEEVCDTVCAGHTFRKTHDIHSISFHDQGSRSRANSMREESASPQDALSTDRTKDRVVVTLNVAPFVHWIIKSQPGALRRVVMNLLGNALKYTEKGFITVSLLQNEERSSAQTIAFTLIVEDSGKGMSTEFQNTRLFAPFSQEDPFSNGTGLGLSIVKQIVESLKGDVHVQSTVGVGTKVAVSLKLSTGALEQARTNQTLTESPKQLKDNTASIVFPSDSLGGVGEKLRESFLLACQGFQMKTSDQLDLASLQPDFLLTEPVSLMDIIEKHAKDGWERPPLAVICVCTDPAEKSTVAAQISERYPELAWVVEVVAQPCGPRKLAKMLLDAQSRPSQSIDSLKVQKGTAQPEPHNEQQPRGDPKAFVQRSMSDMICGSGIIPSIALSGPRSPLVSAAMPVKSTGPPPLAETEIPDTPASQAETGEYFTPRVLLVDDNAINLKLLVVFAQRQNLRYAEATNGLEAYEQYRSEAMGTTPPSKPFDFVLMDLSMPVMGGLESTRKIRLFEDEYGVPRSTIVALTGLASAQDQQDAMDAGVDMYLVKPVKFADIKRLFGSR